MADTYLTYEEYTSFGGKVSSTDFILLEVRARHELDFVTWNRIKYLTAIPDCVKEVMTVIIDSVLVNNPDASDKVTDYSNGVESFKYDRSKKNSYRNDIVRYAQLYLPESLTYRGHLSNPEEAVVE